MNIRGVTTVIQYIIRMDTATVDASFSYPNPVRQTGFVLCISVNNVEDMPYYSKYGISLHVQVRSSYVNEHDQSLSG